MNPFTDLSPRSSISARRFARPAPILLAVCLVVSLTTVAWRAVVRYRTAHASAQAEVQARAALLEFQLGQAATAAESLGALARQGKGGVNNFQKVAKELLNRYPRLSALQLEPNGIVAEVAPREGNERVLGMAVLRDPVQGPGAGQALTNRALAVSGPVRFSHGEQGMVARVPVFVRAPDGRESFWGFVAASMQFQRALSQAQVDQLPRRGYGFALYVPASARQPFNAIAYKGLSSLRDVEQQQVQVQQLELWLGVKPQGGWVNKMELACEVAVALLLSALVWLLAYVLTGRRAVEAELAEATERLAQEQANRSKAEAAYKETLGQLGAAQAELKRAQLALEPANARVAELEASAREREKAVQLEQAKHKEAQAALAKAQESIAQLQTRLEAAAQAEKSTAATAEERLRQNQTALVELRAKLEAATRSAREAAKASAAERAQLEESNRELQARLVKAEQAEARVKELKGLLRQAREELEQRQAAAPESEEAAAAEAEVEAPQAAADDAPALPEEESRAEEAPAVTSSDVVESPVPANEVTPSEASAEAAEPATEPVPMPVAEVAAESTTETSVAVPEPAARTTAAEPPISEPEVQSPPADAPAAAAATEESVAVATEPSVPPKPASKPRRKKVRDDQMDLFGSEAAAANKSPAKAPERAVEPKVSPPAEKPAHRLPPAPPLDVVELRKAVHLILPLLVDQDPGAKDCLRDNRNTFRSAFTPEAYVEFEQLVKRGDFGPALEDLKKAARKHGIAGV